MRLFVNVVAGEQILTTSKPSVSKFTFYPAILLAVLTLVCASGGGAALAVYYGRMSLSRGFAIEAVSFVLAILALGCCEKSLNLNLFGVRHFGGDENFGLGKWVSPREIHFTFVFALGLIISCFVVLAKWFNLEPKLVPCLAGVSGIVVMIHWISLWYYAAAWVSPEPPAVLLEHSVDNRPPRLYTGEDDKE